MTHVPGDTADSSRGARERARTDYRRLFTDAPYAICAVDAKGVFTHVNPAAGAIVGRSPDSLVGRHFAEVVAPEDLDLARDRLREMVAERIGTNELELRVVRADGERRLLHLLFSPIQDADGVHGAHGIVRDITADRSRERYAHRAERLATVGTLLSGVAHELNNPLNAVRNFAQLMLLDDRSEDDREALEIIQQEADRAAKIVADLRLIARQTLDPGSEQALIDLDELVRNVLKLGRYSIETRSVTVVEDSSAGRPRVRANRGELEQVLLNLLMNAEQALEGGSDPGSIEVRIRSFRDTVQLQVRDTGPGIDQEHLERVFDPFWTTKDPGGGTGLGLSLVDSIVSDHGGEISVQNAPEGGAVFTVTLPRAREPEEPAGAPGVDAAPRPLNLLIVDDEAPVRTSVARYLRRRGHEVTEAANGGEALELLEREGPVFDLILTDLRMPKISGEQLVERLRADGRGLERRVVVLTGDSSDGEAARVVESSGAPILTKPIALQDLARALEARAERVRPIGSDPR